MIKRTLIGIAAVFLAGLLPASQGKAAAWDETYFPNLPVVNQDGETLNFYDDLIRDKIVLVNFIYTNCPDICGLSTARMSWVRDELGDRIGNDIFIYSISLDPANDTPELLREYSDAFGRTPGWEFLTGDPAVIDEIRHKLGERSRSLSEHRSDMVMGNDRTGFWRRISMMGNLGIVVRQVRSMDPAYRAAPKHEASVSPDRGHYSLAGTPGQSLFLKACAACHSIGEGDRVGPDLYGVVLRADRDWLLRAVMEPDMLRRTGDPRMTALDARYPGVVMPDLDLSESDAKDVLEYIAARTEMVANEKGVHVHEDGSLHDHGTVKAEAHDHGHSMPEAETLQ